MTRTRRLDFANDGTTDLEQDQSRPDEKVDISRAESKSIESPERGQIADRLPMHIENNWGEIDKRGGGMEKSNVGTLESIEQLPGAYIRDG